MAREVDYNKIDVEALREMELDGQIEPERFQKTTKKRVFDDMTSVTKTGRGKKNKIKRGGKDELPEESDD